MVKCRNIISVSGEVVIKEETASSQDKEILEIEEVVNPSTPEVVLEDLVHSKCTFGIYRVIVRS